MTKALFFLLSSLLAANMYAQPDIQWQLTFGQLGPDVQTKIHQTLDGGYIAIGTSSSIFPEDTTVSHDVQTSNIWVIKLNAIGQVQWQKEYGGPDFDNSGNIIQTDDMGYIFAGTTSSFNNNMLLSDAFVVKIDSLGNIQWQQSYGNSGVDVAQGIQKAANGGYFLFCQAAINGGQVSGNHGSGDMWLVKLSDTGSIEWELCYGGSDQERADAFTVTSDGGCLLSGESWSDDGDVSGNHGGGPPDIWLAKVSASGVLEWQKALGGTGYDSPSAVRQTNDNGYIVTGSTNSNDGDASGYHQDEFYSGDIWVVKLDQSGTIQWQKVLGGFRYEDAGDIQQTVDGGYIVTGVTASTDGDLSGLTAPGPGTLDIWLIKLNAMGDIIWQKRIGGGERDVASVIEQTTDGGFILSGSTTSKDGDVIGATGFYPDFWIVKLSADFVGVKDLFELNPSERLELFPNPAQDRISVKVDDGAVAMSARILDSSGRELSRQIIQHSGFLDVSTLPNGMYFVEVTTVSGKVFSNKFRKQQ